MANKNNKKTMNERTHNPFDTYQSKNKEASNSNNSDPNHMREELSGELSAQETNRNEGKR